MRKVIPIAEKLKLRGVITPIYYQNIAQGRTKVDPDDLVRYFGFTFSFSYTDEKNYLKEQERAKNECFEKIPDSIEDKEGRYIILKDGIIECFEIVNLESLEGEKILVVVRVPYKLTMKKGEEDERH